MNIIHQKTFKITAVFLLLICFIGYGQSFQVSDSLIQKSYSDLLKLYRESGSKEDKKVFSHAYIQKGKRENNIESTSDGFVILSSIYKGMQKVSYGDSIIKYNQNRVTFNYPANGYMIKGEGYFDLRKIKLALDNFLIANEYASQHFFNPNVVFESNHLIGVLKDRIGHSKEALIIHKNNLDFSERNLDKRVKSSFSTNAIHAIAFTYKNMRVLDSAIYYNNLGLEKAKLLKNEKYINLLLLNEGVIKYYMQSFNESRKAIEQSLKYFDKLDSKPNRSEGYFYLAKTYAALQQKELSIKYLKKVDTIFTQTKDLLPEAREGYEMLIDYYKENHNQKLQLVYLERLISLDSILNDNYKYVSKNLSQKYDTQKLIQEKEQIIAVLEKKNTIISSRNWIISILLGISIFGVGYYYYRQELYKKRFLKLLDETSGDNQKNDQSRGDQSGSSWMTKETLDNLLNRLQQFEEKQGYLKQNLNTKDLAKSFGSNSSYLSKVVNTFKEKSFSNYINDLRVDFVIDKLKSDTVFRKYTVKAIAQEIGFNNSEAFAKAFYRKVGIYPCYFIKELSKQTKS